MFMTCLTMGRRPTGGRAGMWPGHRRARPVRRTGGDYPSAEPSFQ
ncbi:hypothetical protein FHU37_001808 [Allostreptomyces psammosilenae]|uniref:Uncharacterized protein n=1 Tax=Allostreptomyces psammosilenae TaxID=1892865 RepID=A0A852ZSQ7_9ACTN|nr:hypothetical protein [Allostreptomyces psammosilenae]